MSQKREVLLLNSSEEVLKIISWKRAVKLLVSGKAVQPHGCTHSYKVRTSVGEYKLPTTLVLLQYVRVPYDDHKATRRNIFRRDKWTCQYCGYKSKDPKKLTIDHVTPKSKGGDSTWTNLVTACPKCNQKKANMSLRDSGMKLKKKPKKPDFYAMRLVGLNEDGIQMWERWINIHIM